MSPLFNKNALLGIIDNICLILEREGAARFMVALPTLSQFRRQKLPDHVELTRKKRIGPRRIVHKSRSSKFPPVIRARWPKDHMTENMLPSMMCVVRGAADMRIEDYVVSCKTGDFIFYPAGITSANGQIPHIEGDISGRQCSLMWIYPGRISEEGVECYLCHSSENGHFVDNHVWCRNPIFMSLFQSIQEETTRQNGMSITFHLLSALLTALHRDVMAEEAVFAPFHLLRNPIEDEEEDLHNPIGRACTYIKANLNKNLTIAIVAKHVFLSPSTFTKLFKQEIGQTFNEYSTFARMEHAAVLLERTSMTIRAISRKIGITENQFRLLARKHWGCTPSEFRSQKFERK